MELLMFYLFAIATIVFALLTVLQHKPVAAAMSLVGAMFSLAGIYVLLHAHLIAALQIIVYAGAVVVLILFVIMLLTPEEKESPFDKRNLIRRFVYISISMIVFLVIVGLFSDGLHVVNPAALQAPGPDFGTTKGVGAVLFKNHYISFEVVSFVLLAAVVGAVILAKKRLDA